MTELDEFLSKLIPALEKELGSERAFELLFSICPPTGSSQDEFREIREGLALAESDVTKRYERVSPLKVLKSDRNKSTGFIASSAVYKYHGTNLISR